MIAPIRRYGGLLLLSFYVVLLVLTTRRTGDYYSSSTGSRRLGADGGSAATAHSAIPLNIYSAWETSTNIPPHMREAGTLLMPTTRQPVPLC